MSENTNPVAAHQETTAPLTISEARQIYVQKNYEAYSASFEHFDRNQRRFKAIWSWWGFAATSGWLVYRKMYVPFLVYMGLVFVIPQLTFDLFADIFVAIGGYNLDTMTPREMRNLYNIVNYSNTLLIMILAGIPIGAAGRWLYYQQVNRKIAKARKKSDNDRVKMSDILKKQGRLNHLFTVVLAVYLILPVGLALIIGQLGVLFMK